MLQDREIGYYLLQKLKLPDETDMDGYNLEFLYLSGAFSLNTYSEIIHGSYTSSVYYGSS